MSSYAGPPINKLGAMNEENNNEYIISTLRWHFEAKNLALQNALRLRCPLSVEQGKELRLYYSEYLAHLISATELLSEKEYPQRENFRKMLKDHFVFEGHPEGSDNYSFIRELRNSVVHRGFDIAAAAHVADNIPMIVVPPSVTNRGGTKTYQSIGYYLLDVVDKCEIVIGPTIARHLSDMGFFNVQVDQDKAVETAVAFIEASNVMPSWAKHMALNNISQINFTEVENAQVDALIKILHTNAIHAIRAQQAAKADGNIRSCFVGAQ